MYQKWLLWLDFLCFSAFFLNGATQLILFPVCYSGLSQTAAAAGRPRIEFPASISIDTV